MNIIRKTRSVCPVCLEFLDALVVEKDGRIFFSKSCSRHGRFEILLSKSPAYYRKLDEFYFAVMDQVKKVREYEIWPTLKCNMNCSICAIEETRSKIEKPEPSCSEVEDFIKKCKVPFFILSGGEPTCRGDLNNIIRILKRYNKAVTINTNGLKLIDISYLNELKKSGLDRVNLQFDGFKRDTYRIFRSTDLLDRKLKVLENLKTLNMPTVLNVTIVRNINEKIVAQLIDYAAKNNFINAITLFTICHIGGARDWSLDNYIMPDELIDIIEEKTNHKITRKNIFLFQKLHLAIKSLLSQRFCFYNQIYVLIRRKGSYEPIDKFLNLTKIEPWLDNYQHIYKQSKILAKMFLIIALTISLLRYCSFFIIKEFIIMAFSYFFKTEHYLKTKRFFYISFSTGCDKYKIDYRLIRNCQNEIVCVDSESGKLEHQGRDGLYCINLEKRRLLKQINKVV